MLTVRNDAISIEVMVMIRKIKLIYELIYNYFYHPLIYSAIIGDLGSFLQRVDAKEHLENDGADALMATINVKQLDSVEALLKAGITPDWNKQYDDEVMAIFANFVDSNGKTYLHYPEIISNINHVKKLLQFTTKIEQQDLSGYTPLLVAIKLAESAIVILLLSSGANLHAINNVTGKTALIEAVESLNPEIVSLILQYKPEINVVDFAGNNALAYAISSFPDLSEEEISSAYNRISNTIQYNNEYGRCDNYNEKLTFAFDITENDPYSPYFIHSLSSMFRILIYTLRNNSPTSFMYACSDEEQHLAMQNCYSANDIQDYYTQINDLPHHLGNSRKIINKLISSGANICHTDGNGTFLQDALIAKEMPYVKMFSDMQAFVTSRICDSNAKLLALAESYFALFDWNKANCSIEEKTPYDDIQFAIQQEKEAIIKREQDLVAKLIHQNNKLAEESDYMDSDVIVSYKSICELFTVRPRKCTVDPVEEYMTLFAFPSYESFNAEHKTIYNDKNNHASDPIVLHSPIGRPECDENYLNQHIHDLWSLRYGYHYD